MEKFVQGFVKVFKWLGAAAIAGMMFLTCIDVVMRAFGRPIFGAVELVGFMATTAMACSLPYTHLMRGHVGVDMLVRKLRPRAQAVVDLMTGLLSLVLFGIVSWRCFAYGNNLKQSGEVSMTLELPSYVFVYVLGLAFVALTLTVLLDVVTAARKAVVR